MIAVRDSNESKLGAVAELSQMCFLYKKNMWKNWPITMSNSVFKEGVSKDEHCPGLLLVQLKEVQDSAESI